MKDLIPTTTLEAVNTMLLNIGSDPVSNLIQESDADVATALHTLHRISRHVQSIGWNFNTDIGYTLKRSAINSEIKLPRNLLSFTLSDRPDDKTLVQRGKRLYNSATHTYKFETDIRADVVLFLDFEELPPVARDYVSLRASREFQNDVAATEDGERDASIEELRAWSAFLRDHSRKNKLNILGGRILNGRRF